MNPPIWETLAAEAEARRRRLRASQESPPALLPLRFWRQAAHLTVPCSDALRIQKAVTRPFATARRLLEQHGLSLEGIATAVGGGTEALEAILTRRAVAPVVLLDAEDAQAPGEAVAVRGRANAVHAFTTLDWGDALRFYRPSGFDEDTCVADLHAVLGGAGRERAPEQFPIDCIVWPKAQHPAEIHWLVETLDAMERTLGLVPGRLRVQLMVESAWGVLRLAELVEAAGPRLCGLVFGIADYSAELGLPRIRNDHPVCDWARAAIVSAAGAAGVPAIDAMTMHYPTADPAQSPDANRRSILDRLRECYEHTLHGLRLGMSGKWAGHPLQLVAVLLAHRAALAPGDLALDVQAVEAYARSLADERGTTLVAGEMSDRATDRQRRTRLRRAVALGALDVQRGLALGIVTAEEAAQLAPGP